MYALLRTVSLALAIAALTLGCGTQLPKANAPKYEEMDKLQRELASRAAQRLGAAQDFQIVVTQADFPIGTLLRPASTIPIDYAACAPSSAPPQSSVPSLFPAYVISRSLAASFGLDNQALSKIADLGVDLSDTDTINLSVASPRIQTLSDSDIDSISSIPKCAARLGTQAVWLVRGYISGKRTFELKSAGKAEVDTTITKIGSFDLDLGSGSSSLGLTDESATAFLQIISEVYTPVDRGPSYIAKPKSTGTAGRVYVQQDSRDTTNSGAVIVTALTGSGFLVGGPPEKIDSAKMPRRAQVRYFNHSDKTAAEKALALLQERYPDAIATHIGLPAPIGQIEVWLPRTI